MFGAVAGPGGRASAWQVTTGARRWSQYGDGDVQAVALVGDTLYAGGHYDPQFGAANGTATLRSEISAIDAATGAMLAWSPDVTGSDGVWALSGDNASLWIGGGYTRVGNQTTFGRLTRFGVDAGQGPTDTQPPTTPDRSANGRRRSVGDGQLERLHGQQRRRRLPRLPGQRPWHGADFGGPRCEPEQEQASSKPRSRWVPGTTGSLRSTAPAT